MQCKVNGALATALLLTCCALSTLATSLILLNCAPSYIVVSASGGTYEQRGCTVSVLIISASSTFRISPVIFTLNNGRVDSGTSNGIVVVFPVAADANLSLPLHFVVANMDFGQDAALKFSGVLPKNSSLIVANNSFYLTTSNTFTLTSMIAAILLGDRSEDLALENATSINIINNTIKANITSTNNFAAISIPASSVRLSHCSALIVNNNIVRGRYGAGYTDGVMNVLKLYSESITLLNRSLISASGNIINNSVASIVYAVLISLSPESDGDSGLHISHLSGISITNNTIQGTTVSVSACTAFLSLEGSEKGNKVTLDHASSIALDGNALVNLNGSSTSSYVVYVRLDSINGMSSIDLHRGSGLSMNNNIIRNVTNTSGCYCALLFIYSSNSNSALLLTSHSSVAINNNTIVNITGINMNAGICSAFVNIATHGNNSCNMILSDATFSMSNNNLRDNVGGYTNAATVRLDSYGNSYLGVQNKSVITLSRNGISGCAGTSAYGVLLSATSYYRGVTTVSVSNESSIELNENSIVISRTSYSAYAVYILMASYTVCRMIFSEFSALVLSNNSVHNSTISFGCVALVYLEGYAQPASIELDRAIFAVENNHLDNDVALSNVYIFIIGNNWQAKLSNASSMFISNNSVKDGGPGGLVTVVSFSNLLTIQCLNSSIQVADNYIMTSYPLEFATILAVSGGSLILKNSSLLLVTNNFILGRELNASIVNFLDISPNLHWNSSIVVSRNTIRASSSGIIIPQLSIISANGIIQGVGESKLIIYENNVTTSSISSSLSTSNCQPSIQLIDVMNVSIFSVTRNTIKSSCHTMVRISGNMTGLEAFDITDNQFTFLPNSSSINNTLLSFAGSIELVKGSMVRIEGNIIIPSYSQGHTGFQLLNTSSNINWNLTDISACGNTAGGELLTCPRSYILPAPPSNIVFCASTQHLCGPIAPTVSLTVSHTATRFLSLSGTTQATSMSDSSQSLSISINIAHTISARQLSESSIPSDTSSCLRSESIDQSTSTSIDGRRPSVTLLKTGSQTTTAAQIITHTHHVFRATVTVKKATEPAPILPVAVPPATTATLSVVSSTLGGVSSAVDSQVIAAVGLVSCARKAGDDKDSDLRALSAVALDNTCEGVLLGNTIAIAVGAILTVVSVVVMRGVQVFRYNRVPIGPAPTLVTACAMARAPQLLLTLCAYFMSSYALCGLQIGGAGLVAFVFSIVVVVSFPVLTVLFGARQLLRVTYGWQPRILGSVGSFVFQSWVLDPSIDSHKLFGSVFGSYRRLSCWWALTAHMSFIAGLPMMVATESSGTCGPLFAVSSALFFLFSVIVVAARPRRTTLADVLHSQTLLVNGLVTANAATILYNPDDGAPKSLLDKLGTAITVLTILRLVHSAGAIFLGFLMRRGSYYWCIH